MRTEKESCKSTTPKPAGPWAKAGLLAVGLVALWLTLNSVTWIEGTGHAAAPAKVSEMATIAYAKDDDLLYLVHNSGVAYLSRAIRVDDFLLTAIAGNTNFNFIWNMTTNTEVYQIFYTSNFFAGDTYVTNFYATNVLQDVYVSNYFQTNFVGPWYITSNWTYQVNDFSTDNYISNYFTTNILNDTYVSNYWATNIFNSYATNYSTNIYYTINNTNFEVFNLTVYSNATIKTAYISNLYFGGALQITNTWAGPTNRLDLGTNGSLFYSTLGHCAVTGYTGNASFDAPALLTIRNGSGSNVTLTLHAQTMTGDGARSYTITNGLEAKISFSKAFDRTNAVFRLFY